MLTGKERMTLRTDINVDFGNSRAGGEFVTTSAGNLAIRVILRMNSLFHRVYFSTDLLSFKIVMSRSRLMVSWVEVVRFLRVI